MSFMTWRTRCRISSSGLLTYRETGARAPGKRMHQEAYQRCVSNFPRFWRRWSLTS